MQIIKDVDQGSDEWLNLRLGMITASKFKDVMAQGSGITRSKYMRQLAAETLTCAPVETYSNSAMEWGVETEPQARAMYELDKAVEVNQVSFIRHDTLKVGCSPDGLVGDNGLVEFKCPNTTTQIETYLGGKMPTSHKPQVQGQLWISEREWTDFVSFDPRISGESSYFCVKVSRDEDYIRKLREGVKIFQSELLEMLEKLT